MHMFVEDTINDWIRPHQYCMASSFQVFIGTTQLARASLFVHCRRGAGCQKFGSLVPMAPVIARRTTPGNLPLTEAVCDTW